VEGWTAKESYISIHYGKKIKSYEVSYCPEFEDAREGVRTVGEKKQSTSFS
jgi:hypothetical protein